jgi:hypothetical protein
MRKVIVASFAMIAAAGCTASVQDANEEPEPPSSRREPPLLGDAKAGIGEDWSTKLPPSPDHLPPEADCIVWGTTPTGVAHDAAAQTAEMGAPPTPEELAATGLCWWPPPPTGYASDDAQSTAPAADDAVPR